MSRIRFSRRELLTAAAAGALASHAGKLTPPARAQARTTAAEPVTPALLDAAKKEGKVAFYTAMDLPVAEKFAKTFEARFPGITVRVERSGAERVFQRIGQEVESRIHAVDVVNSADGAHFIAWKRNTWLAPDLPGDVGLHDPPRDYDPVGVGCGGLG